MTILIAILALSVLIIVHELGHFAVAKLTGIKVLEFSLFMGTKLFSKKIGETEYSIRSVPLGGFVRMEGEEEASDDDRAYNKKPKLVRAAVLAAGPLANLITAFIIVLVINIISGYNTTTLSKLDQYSPAAQAGLKAGDTIVSYNGKGVYHPLDISLFLYGSKGLPMEIGYVRAGQTGIQKKQITPEIIEKNRYILGYSPNSSTAEGWNEVAGIVQGASAGKEGLKKGDRILSLNSTPVSNARDIREFLKINKGMPVKVTILRNTTKKDITITPMRTKEDEQYNIGISFKYERGTFISAASHSVRYVYSLSRYVYYSLTWIITGKVSLSQLSGPVGIVTTIGDVVQQSPTITDKFIGLLNIMALISINLGWFNLIPIPALDGSKLLLLVVEVVRRKALPPEKEALISMVGFVLLIMLMIFTVYNDILRLVVRG